MPEDEGNGQGLSELLMVTPDGPDVEDSLHHLLDTALLEQAHQRRHAGHVNRDLSENGVIFLKKPSRSVL